MCKSRLFLCCMVALLGFGPSAFGQPPDKQTPAAESACNFLKADEFTKGLYGLCVAFCKAKNHAGESSQSLKSILANYEKKQNKERGDPDMPCLDTAASQPPVTAVQACPCWTDVEASAIDGVLSDGSTATGWPAPTNIPSVCSAAPTNLYLSEYLFWATEHTYIHTVEQSTIHRCEYQQQTPEGGVWRLLQVEDGTLTMEQFAACEADLLARQAALGVCQ